MRKDPSSKTELKGKATMKYGAPKVKNVTSQKSEELLRVARKVNARLKNSILEVEKEIREALEILKECGRNRRLLEPNSKCCSFSCFAENERNQKIPEEDENEVHEEETQER